MNSTTKLSEHFTLQEALYSATAAAKGIDNSRYTDEQYENMLFTASRMEIVRTMLGDNPIHINSWLRCIELNRAVGSRDTSQHIQGKAVDFVCPSFGSCYDIALALSKREEELAYDQLILEMGWIHISFTKVNPRKQELTIKGHNQTFIGFVK